MRPRRAAAAALLSLAGAGLLAACGGGEDADPPAEAHGLEHVHGLGVNPADGDTYIATHTGVYQVSRETGNTTRVGEGLQDTMGFTVVGPDHFVASGHPGPGEPGPPNLGLIESLDGGQSWREVSLAGEADFHVLHYAHDRLYGYDAGGGRIMISDDGGESWTQREPPGSVIDLAIDPGDPDRILASTDRGIASSDDQGRGWQRIGDRGRVGMIAWPVEERLYLIDAAGAVHLSADRGRGWRRVGSIAGLPAALVAEGPRKLLAASSDGTVLESDDGGAAWHELFAP